MIDNYETAQVLMKKIKSCLPLTVYPTEKVTKLLKYQGKNLKLNEPLKVTDLFDSGDEGGILCSIITNDSENPQQYVLSITHLRIPDDHPLADEIMSYQQKRTLKLALNDGKKGKAMRMIEKSKKKKGFG